MKVSIVIPNYNGKRFIENCLISLKRQNFTDYEIIFVDNGSTDDSVDFVLNNYPNVYVEQLNANYGFSTAVNKGINLAQAEFVVLLNTDTEATEDWLGNLVKCIESDNNIFSCASKMIQYNNREKIDDAGDWYSIMGWAYQEGHGKSIDQYIENRSIFSSCAGAAIYRKVLFEKLGYFDEFFFAYLEDVDIGYRAIINGYKNIFCSNAQIYHIGSATSGGGYSPFKVKLSSRNNIFLLYKNMPFLQLFVNSPFVILGIIIKYIYFRKINLHRDYLAGLKEGFKSFNSIKKTKFKMNNLKNYLMIETILIRSTIKYAIDKLK